MTWADAIADADAQYWITEAFARADAVQAWASREGTPDAQYEADVAYASANSAATTLPAYAEYQKALNAAAGVWYASVIPASLVHSRATVANDLAWTETLVPAWATREDAYADNQLAHDLAIIPLTQTLNSTLVQDSLAWVSGVTAAGVECANSQISNAVAWIGDLSEALNELSQARTDTGVQANNAAVDAGVTAVGDAGGALIDWANTVEVSAPAGEETLGNTVTLWWPPDTDFDGNPIASGQRTFGPGTSRHVYEQFKASHPGAMELDGQIPEWLPSQFLPTPPAPPEPPSQAETEELNDFIYAVVPGLSDVRDVYEIVIGLDMIRGEELSWGDWGITVVGAAIPWGVSGRSLRYGGEQVANGHFWNWMRRGANNAPAGRNLVGEAGDSVKRWLGDDFVVKRSDAKGFVAVSKDGTRKFRLDFDGHGYAPHGHLELWDDSKQRWIDAIKGQHHLPFK